MRIKLSLILFFALSPKAFGERLYGHFDPPKFKAQRIGLKYEMDYFDASGNFLENGDKESLASTNSFSAYNFHFQTDYDLSSKGSLTFGFQVGASSSEDIEFGRDNSTLKGIFFGGAYKLKVIKGWASVLDARYYLTQAKNSRTRNKVSVGDGVNWLGGGLWLGRRVHKKAILWMYGGVKLRSGGLSDLFLYSIRPQIKLNKKFRLGFGVEGFLSFSDDKFTSDPAPRLEVTSGFNGNSLRYYSVNPAYHEVQGWVGYRYKPYSVVRLGFANPVLGENTATGLRAFLTLETSMGWNGGGLSFSFKPIKKKKYRSRKKKKSIFYKKKTKKKSPFRVK